MPKEKMKKKMENEKEKETKKERETEEEKEKQRVTEKEIENKKEKKKQKEKGNNINIHKSITKKGVFGKKWRTFRLQLSFGAFCFCAIFWYHLLYGNLVHELIQILDSIGQATKIDWLCNAKRFQNVKVENIDMNDIIEYIKKTRIITVISSASSNFVIAYKKYLELRKCLFLWEYGEEGFHLVTKFLIEFLTRNWKLWSGALNQMIYCVNYYMDENRIIEDDNRLALYLYSILHFFRITFFYVKGKTKELLLEAPLSSSIKRVLFTTYLISYLDGGQFDIYRKWRWFQYLSIWRYICKGYFHAKLHFMEKISKEDQYIFVAHPHGIFTWNHFLVMTNSLKFLSHIHNDNRRDLAASVLFYIPGIRELLLWLGNVDAGSKTATKVLQKGMSLYIYAGGEFEQILTERGKDIIYVRKRKGFVKLAIKYGVPIIPLYCFGENDLYYTLSHQYKGIQLYLSKKFHIALPPGVGRFFCTIIPLRIPLHMCFGKIIRVERESNPSKETIERVHKEYMQAIQQVFETYKHEFGYGDRELIVK